MLVRVAVDCDALTTGDSPELTSQHQRLTRILLKNGVLVRTREHDLEALLNPHGDKSRKLSVNALQAWSAVIDKVRWLDPTEPIACLCTIGDAETFRRSWAKQADVAVVEETRGQELGLPEGEAVHLDEATGIELAHLWSFDGAQAFERAEELTQRKIWEGADRKDIWNDRFDLLARTSLHVAVVDRYAGLNLVEARRKGRISGLEWFLQRLCEYPRTYVTLILGVTGYDKGLGERMVNKDQVLQEVRQVVAGLPERGVEDVKLTLVLETEFGNISHGRRIRFENFVVGLDKGLTVFDHSAVASSCDCFDLNDTDTRDYERRLLQVARLRSGWPAEVLLRKAQ